jgi:hypothetical protein
MGRAKDWEIEQEERGWWGVPGRYVCPECFDDESLKQVIRENAAASSCDYCELTSEDLTGEAGALIAAPFDSVMEVIAEGLKSEWNDANNESIPYESAEGGYQADTTSSYDLVWNVVCPKNESLAQEIIDALPDHVWVERQYYSLTQDQALWYGWENFCEVVKHQNRYMFHLRTRVRRPEAADAPSPTSAIDAAIKFGFPPGAIEKTESESPDFEEVWADAQEGISASRMLDEIGDAVQEVGLIRNLPPATNLFRGRIGSSKTPYRTARRLGPPPPKKATASRMSPAGIPMFYGALEEKTAIAETIFGKLKSGQVVNVGTFLTLAEIPVLDLTHLKQVPSLFSRDRDLRPVLKFLHAFVGDLSKPIKKDGREHIDYVPTQIVTEYFRHSFQSYDRQPVRGILYPSSRAKGGTACVLFFTREECGAPERGAFAGKREQRLRFVKGSAKTFKRKRRKP